jgi:anion-transporting  ArsA/GET3 family ATPase
MGPIKSQADNVMRMFRSPRTAVHLVTVLEEMPVQETADGIEELRTDGLPVGGVVVNMVRPQDLDAKALTAARSGRLDPASLAAELKSAGVEVDDDIVEGLLAEAHDHAERRGLEDAQRELVRRLDAPTYELPRMPGGVDLGALYELAASLKDQGLA